MTTTSASAPRVDAAGLRGAPALPKRPDWLPVWSKPAALRAVRATVVVCGLFALAHQVVGNAQMATYAAFGGFATLVLASFGGTRRDRLMAHLGLAVVGSVLLTIGTAVSSSAAVAAVVSVAVAFAVLFAGVAGPNAASGATAALLMFVLPAASAGTMAMVPSRLAGWWLASVAGTLAVLLLSPRPEADRLRSAAAASADAIADELDAAAQGRDTAAYRSAAIEARSVLMIADTSTPYRPVGLATPSQAVSNVVETLEWCTALAEDALAQVPDPSRAGADRDLLVATADVLRDVAGLLRGHDASPDLDRLERLRAASAAHVHGMGTGSPDFVEAVDFSFHARSVALAARAAAADALIASRRADRLTIAGERRRWYGASDERDASAGEGPRAAVATVRRVVSDHAGLRSVWFRNSLRGAVAFAAAVAVADLSNVEHGFWVVLAALSVLRTNAASTGSTVLRALAGTVAGFAIGAALVLAIGANTAVLWAVFPVALVVAAYAPGTMPFVVGQAGFTVVITVLFNLIAPVGWTVGVVRVEDVAIGCGVALVVGALFWPRGAAGVVGTDLADAFRQGATYLSQAVNWALGLRPDEPDAGVAAVTAALHLDDALRGFLAEQGTKRVPREDLWHLVGGTIRLRLTANSLARLPNPVVDPDPARAALRVDVEHLADWYGHLADAVGGSAEVDLSVPEVAGLDADSQTAGGFGLVAGATGGLNGNAPRNAAKNLSCTLWVGHQLRELQLHLPQLLGPAAEVAKARRRPWWR